MFPACPPLSLEVFFPLNYSQMEPCGCLRNVLQKVNIAFECIIQTQPGLTLRRLSSVSVLSFPPLGVPVTHGLTLTWKDLFNAACLLITDLGQKVRHFQNKYTESKKQFQWANLHQWFRLGKYANLLSGRELDENTGNSLVHCSHCCSGVYVLPVFVPSYANQVLASGEA